MRIFISHSVREDPEAEAFAHRLKSALVPDFDVFFDLDDLKVGIDWESTLCEAAVRSDVGILILSRKLLERSTFTRTEIAWFVGGRDRGQCQLFPVLLDNLSEKDIAASNLGAFRLQKSQFVDGSNVERAFAEIRQQLVGISARLTAYLEATALRLAKQPSVLSAFSAGSKVHPPTLRRWLRPDATSESERKQAAHLTVEALTLLDPPHDLIVRGGSGAGKSTLLRFLASELITLWNNRSQRRWLPIWVSALRLARASGDLHARLQAVSPEAESVVSLPAKLFESGPSQNSGWLVLVDGIDEVPVGEREHFLELVKTWAAPKVRHHRFVLTSRPSAAPNDYPFENYDVLPIAQAELTSFASALFAGFDRTASGGAAGFVDALGRSPIRDRLGNPLLIVLAATAYVRSGGRQLPPTRSALYTAYLADRLSNESERWKSFRDDLPRLWDRMPDGQLAAKRLLLRVMDPLAPPAVRAKDKGEPLLCALARVPPVHDNLARQAAAWAQTAIPEWPPDFNRDPQWVSQQFVEILLATGLFEQSSGNLDFIHDSFRDFLAAWERAASGTRAALETLESSVGRQHLEEALFLVGLARDRGEEIAPLVERLLQAPASPDDDEAWSARVVAAHIIAEYQTEASLAQRVIAALGGDVTELFALLALVPHYPEARKAVLERASSFAIWLPTEDIVRAGDWDLLRELIAAETEVGAKIDCAEALSVHAPDEAARWLYKLVPIAGRWNLGQACAALARLGNVACGHSALLYAYRSANPSYGFEYLAELSALTTDPWLGCEAERLLADPMVVRDIWTAAAALAKLLPLLPHSEDLGSRFAQGPIVLHGPLMLAELARALDRQAMSTARRTFDELLTATVDPSLRRTAAALYCSRARLEELESMLTREPDVLVRVEAYRAAQDRGAKSPPPAELAAALTASGPLSTKAALALSLEDWWPTVLNDLKPTQPKSEPTERAEVPWWRRKIDALLEKRRWERLWTFDRRSSVDTRAQSEARALLMQRSLGASRNRVLDKLVAIDLDDETLGTLRAVARDGEEQLGIRAAFVLLGHGDPNAVLDCLVRKPTMTPIVLAGLNDAAYVKVLRRGLLVLVDVLVDEAPTVRAAGGIDMALAYLADEGCRFELTSLATSARPEWLRIHAARRLAKSPEPTTEFERLTRRNSAKPDEQAALAVAGDSQLPSRVRAAAIDSIGRAELETTVDRLRVLATDSAESLELRRHAILALGEALASNVLEDLRRTSKDDALQTTWLDAWWHAHMRETPATESLSSVRS